MSVRPVGKVLRDPHSLAPLVMAMGFVGASLRYILEMLLPAGGGFPFATLAVNIFGCFMLEIINQHIAIRTKLPGPLVKSMGIGLIGAFTTVSAFSTESLSFLQSGRYGTFALYVSATIVATFVAAWLGKIAADKLGEHMLANKAMQEKGFDMREPCAGFDARRDSVRPCGVAEDGKACADEKAEQ